MEQKRQCQRDRGAGYKNRVSLSSVQAAHEQHTPVHTCWSVCGCTAEPPSTLQRLWLASVTWQLWNFFTGNPQQRWEKQKYSLVSTFMPYTIRKFSLLLLWTAVRGHSLESLWHTDVPRDATGSSRSLWGQCAPHTSKGLNPTDRSILASTKTIGKIYYSYFQYSCSFIFWRDVIMVLLHKVQEQNKTRSFKVRNAASGRPKCSTTYRRYSHEILQPVNDSILSF